MQTRQSTPSITDKHAALVEQACRTIEASPTPPSLRQLAAQAGLSAYHFQRLFKAALGLTPKAYADAQRTRRLQQDLAQPHASITEAIYNAGFNSNSRFYENANQLLGMQARQYRQGGANSTIWFAVGECTLGSILVARSAVGICAISLGNDPQALLADLQARFHQATLIGADAEFEQWVAQVTGLIEDPHLALNLPLDIRGTAFQQRVWQALRAIPPGTTITYTELANRIGAPKAARAVANACAQNTLAVAIPCHRVIRQSGDMAGYRWGIDRKRELLKREAQANS